METFRTMIVPVEHVALARSLAEGLSKAGGANMWLTPLSSTGTAPATHFISTGYIKEEFAVLMTDAQLIHNACDASVPLVSIQAMLSASDISEEEPFAAMTRLSLKMVQE